MLRHVGKIEQANDSAASLVVGYLSPGASLRISEFGAQDGFVKVTQEGTAVTATNGSYIRANSTITIVPEERPKSIQVISATSADPVVLTVADRGAGTGINHPFAVAEQVSFVDSDVAAWNTLITNVNVSAISSTTITLGAVDGSTTATFTGDATLRSSFSVSHINETAGSNSKIYVEEVVLAHSGV